MQNLLQMFVAIIVNVEIAIAMRKYKMSDGFDVR